MDFTRAELKAQAKEQLQGKVWKLFGIAVVMFAINFAISLVVSLVAAPLSGIVSFFVTGPLTLGLIMVYLNVTYGDEPEVATLFAPFKMCYLKSVGLYFLVGLFTVLWSLLFIIPGIIAGYSYSQAFLILAENPDMPVMDCIKASKEMMKGNKWNLFVLQLSFILWCLLGSITLGLAYIYVVPYMQLTFINFYHRIKGDAPVNAIDVAAGAVVSE